MRDWLARYRAGEHQQVWCEMRCASVRDLRQRRLEAQEVATVTIHAVIANVIRIEGDLRGLGYDFSSPPGAWTSEPLAAPPAPRSGRVIGNPRFYQPDLDDYVRHVAPLPISLHAFWSRVGWLDFSGRQLGDEATRTEWCPLVVNPPSGIVDEFEEFLETGPGTGFRFPLARPQGDEGPLGIDMQFGADARLTSGEWFLDHLRRLTQAGGIFHQIGAADEFADGLRRIRAEWIPF